MSSCSPISQLEERIGDLWPAARAGFPWQWLVDPQRGEGAARFDRQYWRANVDPSARYAVGARQQRRDRAVQPVPGRRLAAHRPDAGCVEAAVTGAMQAARAFTGYPERIEGDSDFLKAVS